MLDLGTFYHKTTCNSVENPVQMIEENHAINCGHKIPLQFEIFHRRFVVKCDKVWMYEEMITNNDNLESSLLTSILLNIRSLYKFCYKLHMSSWRPRWTEL